MQIHFFVQSKDYGGAERFAIDLANSLQETQGVAVTLHTTNEHILSQPQLTSKKIPIYLDFAGNLRGLVKSLLLTPFACYYYFFLLRGIKKRNPQAIILASGFSEKIAITSLCAVLQLKIAWIEYGPLDAIIQKFSGLPGLLYRYSVQHVHKVITASMHSKKALQTIIPHQKLLYLPCGSKTPQLTKSRKEANYILNTSRMELGKGQDVLIAAFKQLRTQFPTLKLYLIGEGSQLESLKNLAAHDQNIIFLGRVAETQTLIEASKIVICPSVWELEGFGLVVTEAMALGKAIVAFDRAPYNELIVDQKTALLAKEISPTALAQTIARALKNHQLRNKLGKQARKVFLEKYQIDRVALRYKELLEQL